MNECVNALKN